MRRDNSKFLSLLSVTAITFMLALFFYSLPDFLMSAKGIIFAAVWIGFAGIMLAAHFLNLTTKKRRQFTLPDLKRELAQVKMKNARAGKKVGLARVMRG